MYRIPAAVTATFTALALTSCFSLSNPFKRQPPEPDPGQSQGHNPQGKPKPNPEPAKPIKLAPEVNAFYETSTTSFFVMRPQSERTDRLPDKLLQQGTVVQMLVPQAGSGWARVRLDDAQTGYVPLSDVKVVPAAQRPSGYSAGRSRINTGPLSLPAVPKGPDAPDASDALDAPKADPIDDINFDLPGTESPADTLPGTPPSGTLPESPSILGEPGEIDSSELPGL